MLTHFLTRFASQVFRTFDENHDGTCTRDEFRRGLENGLGCAIATPDYDLLVNHVDADNSGRIDYFEFADKMKMRDIESFKKDDRQDQHAKERRSATAVKGTVVRCGVFLISRIIYSD